MSFRSQKILVVGGAGFVGSNLCYRLLQDNPKELVIVDNLLSADVSNVPTDPNVTFVQGSISDDKVLFRLPVDFDYIFHLATYHGNQSSMADPLADHENNNITTLKICEYFKGSKALKKLVYSSAGCTVAQKTFDAPEATREDDSVSLYLDSPYQISKIVGEFYGNYYLLRHQLPFVKARFQNVYGPREILGAGKWRGTPATVWRNVTPTFIWKALHGQKLPLEKGGVATRDFIYVSDIVEGLVACALKGEPGGVYNLASGEETSIRQLAELICEIVGDSSLIQEVDARPWDRSGRRYGDPGKTEHELGVRCQVSLKQGLEQTIQWTKAHREKILICMQQHQRYVAEVKIFSQELVTP